MNCCAWNNQQFIHSLVTEFELALTKSDEDMIHWPGEGENP
jgi:hypothetical protein